MSNNLEKVLTEYYLSQAKGNYGGGSFVNYYKAGTHIQRGNGIGSFLGGIFR